MIENWWSKRKHQWLFLHRLEKAAAMRRYVEFYVAEYNATIPHVAFAGQMPDEVYFGRREGIEAKLEAGNQTARARRLKVNRATWCKRCPGCSAGVARDVTASSGRSSRKVRRTLAVGTSGIGRKQPDAVPAGWPVGPRPENAASRRPVPVSGGVPSPA